MKIKEIKIVEAKVEKVTGVICDKCGRAIIGNEKDHFFEVTTHHSDWGNDSRDSYRYFDLCRPECLLDHLTDYLAKAGGSEEYDIARIEKRKGGGIL